MLLCKNSLLAIAPNAPIQYIDQYFELFGITDLDEQVNFLTQVIHESGHFKHKMENLNYIAQGLANTWPSRFANKDKTPNEKATSIARKPQLIANAVYNGRMGNRQNSDDGWNYRGRGYIQLTGRDNYKAIGQYLSDRGIIDDPDLLILNPDLVSDDQYAVATAIAFWVKNKCWDGVGDIEKITKRVNGGKIGLNDRLAIRTKLYDHMT